MDSRIKRFTLQALDGSEVMVVKKMLDFLSNVISTTTTRRLIKNECEAYLAYVLESKKENPSIREISIVCDFLKLFYMSCQVAT